MFKVAIIFPISLFSLAAGRVCTWIFISRQFDFFFCACFFKLYFFFCVPVSLNLGGVVGCGEDVYLTSPGRPTDIGLQLGKACCPCRR